MKRILILTAAVLAATATAAPYTTPNTFAPGAPIKAAEMNANFQGAQTELRRLDARVTGFLHKSTAANITSNWTCIDNPASNGDPNALVYITHNYNPGGSGGSYAPYPLGVWYYTGKWCIYYQDTSKAMPAGINFNVLVVKP